MKFGVECLKKWPTSIKSLDAIAAFVRESSVDRNRRDGIYSLRVIGERQKHVLNRVKANLYGLFEHYSCGTGTPEGACDYVIRSIIRTNPLDASDWLLIERVANFGCPDIIFSEFKNRMKKRHQSSSLSMFEYIKSMFDLTKMYKILNRCQPIWEDRFLKSAGKPAELEQLRKAVELPIREIQLTIVVLATVGLVILIIVTPELRYRLELLFLGSRWLMRTKNNNHIISVRAEETGKVEIEVDLYGHIESSQCFETSVNLPPDRTSLAPVYRHLLKNSVSDTNVKIEIKGSALFSLPWSLLIGSPFSTGDLPIIAGQIAIIDIARSNIIEADPTLVSKETKISVSQRVRQIIRRGSVDVQIALLGCDNALKDGHNGKTLPRLSGLATHLRALYGSFQASKLFAQPPLIPCNRESFLHALQTFDVVHFAGHGDEKGIYVDNGRQVTGKDLVALNGVRCRLLILSSCLVGNLGNQKDSLTLEAIRKGMNVIAATLEMDQWVLKQFFSVFYAKLIPCRKREGTTIAEAIRFSAKACQSRFSDASRVKNDSWREYLDSIILYCDPSLHFTFNK